MYLSRPSWTWVAVAVTLLLAHAANAEPRPMTHEDLWLMPRTGAPVVSPDGRLAVVSLTRPAYDSDEQRSNLWLLHVDGSEPPRQLTFTRRGESDPAWSPDSRMLAFSARREDDEVRQIWLLDLRAGGEERPLTRVVTGARKPVFSPDGTRIAFVSDVHPDSRSEEDSRRIKAEEDDRKHNVLTYTGFPIRHWDRWLPERQARLFVQGIDGVDAIDLLADSELVRKPGYSGRFALDSEELDPVWAPDGESLIFVAGRNRHRAAFDFTHTDLWQVRLDGSEPVRLTGEDDLAGGDNWSAPAFTPDGNHLLALRRPRTDRVYNANRLAVLRWPEAELRAQIELPDGRAVLEFATTSDAGTVYMLGDDAGHVKLYQAGLDDGRAGTRAGSRAGGRAELAFDMDRGIYTGLSGARDSEQPVLLASYQSATQPAEAVSIDLAAGGHEALTAFAASKAAELDLPPLEHFWFENDRGQRIHSMLVKPAGFDPERRYPLFVMMRGGPHLMSRDYFFLRWNYHLLAGSDRVVLLTNYVGSTGFGERFAQAIQGDPLRGPADDINQAADVAIERFDFIDGSRQCAGGASYGGHLANWLQSSTDRYRCLISHAGLVNLESQWATSDVAYSREVNMGGPPWAMPEVWSEQNPIRHAERWQTPVLVTIGVHDYRVPLNNVLEYWTALQRQQVESRLLVFPDENHWIRAGHNSKVFYQEVEDWLQQWLE